MTRRQVAVSFVRFFCEGRIPELGSLLTDDFQFEGPFLTSASREGYLAALSADPPEPAWFELHRVFEDGEEVCLVYEYRKRNVSVLMAQWTRFRGQKIRGITLLFDGRAFG